MSQDPRGNLLRQWLAVDAVHGVLSEEFLLSENPPLGLWRIVTNVSVSVRIPSVPMATRSGETAAHVRILCSQAVVTEKRFSVAEYGGSVSA